jgi:NADPH:quinone reductase-like Zn-dependent oxidoreductase
VEGLAVGDRVAVIPGEISRGYYGEVALAPARTLVKIPHDQNWQEVAATWMAFATAWTGLVDIGRLLAGQTVLIAAASSSTPVALTRTCKKAAELLDAGAARVIATEEQDLAILVPQLTGGKGAELVFDAVGGPSFEKLVDATVCRSRKPYGKI